MTVYDKIRDLIYQFVSGTITAATFRDQFVPFFAESGNADPASAALAIDVESIYADFLSDRITEEQFKGRLVVLVPYKVASTVVVRAGFTMNNTGTQSVRLDPQSVFATRSTDAFINTNDQAFEVISA